MIANRLILCVQCLHQKWALTQVPVAPLTIQLSFYGLGKQQQMASVPPVWEIQKKLLAVGFRLTHLQLLWSLAK